MTCMVVRTPARKQSRRDAWQDSNSPSLARFALFAEDCDDLISGLPSYLQSVARYVIDHLDKPVKLPPGTKPSDARDVMSVVYRLRFHHRAELRVEGDPELPRDYAMSLEEICKLYREEMLAERGFRSAAHGISEMRDASGSVTGYRVQTWGDTTARNGSIRTGHLHIGYAKTIEDAYRMQAKWWLKERKIDLTKMACYQPDSAIAMLAEAMVAASINAGNDEYWRKTVAEFASKDD